MSEQTEILKVCMDTNRLVGELNGRMTSLEGRVGAVVALSHAPGSCRAVAETRSSLDTHETLEKDRTYRRRQAIGWTLKFVGAFGVLAGLCELANRMQWW